MALQHIPQAYPQPPYGVFSPSAVEAVPGNADRRDVSFKLNEEKLTDTPRLRQEVQKFTAQCSMSARAKLPPKERPGLVAP